MAAISAPAVTLSSRTVTTPAGLSSRSALAPRIVSLPPCKAAPRSFTVRASAQEEPRAPRKELLAGLVAAGAALVVAGSSFAVIGPGPGNDGAAITNKQADELLKAGDKLTNEDSPQRFGGERVGDQALRNAGKVAQQAGSGAVSGLQNNADTGASAIDTARENVQEAGKRLGDLFQQNKTGGDLSSIDIQGGVQDLLNNGPEKVKSDLDTASGKVKSDISTTKSKVSNDVASTRDVGKNVSGKAESVLSEAQGKAGRAVDEGKGLLGDLKSKITGAIPN